MDLLVFGPVAMAIASAIWGAFAASRRRWRHAVQAMILAVACIAFICSRLISQDDSARRAPGTPPLSTTQPSNPQMPPKTRSGVLIGHLSVGVDRFTTAHIDLRQAELRLFWKRPNGARFGNFDALSEALKGNGQALIFATNAGIFEPTFIPCGLHAEDGRELTPLNLASGDGNFYMKPNGVFMVEKFGAHIVDSTKYRGTTFAVKLATQSGPLLVIDGQINSRFDPNSPNRRVRSGVGVSSPQAIDFVISDQPVTFYALASVFLNRIGCHNALYLDGVISQFYLPGERAKAPVVDFAGILAVTESRTKSVPTTTNDQ